MALTSLLICLLLIGQQNSVHSYSKTPHGVVNGNGIECTDEDNCEPNKRSPQQPTQHLIKDDRNGRQTQQHIDCETQQNCQTFHSQRQQPNDCHNRNDCQTNTDAKPHRRSHRRRNNHHNRHTHDEQGMSSTVSITSLQVWNCEFSENDCGIHNQYNMDSYFTLMPDSAEPVFGRSGILYLDLARAQSTGARLITPYFPTNGCRFGCLTIEYILCGNSIENLYLIQQDVRNYCVWQKANDRTYRWMTSSMTVDLSRGNPRFFVEVRFDARVNSNGFVGISDMKFRYGECDHNEANECDLNRFVDSFI